jgi:hypothetical protein
MEAAATQSLTPDQIVAMLGDYGYRPELRPDGEPTLRKIRGDAVMTPNVKAVLRWHREAIVDRLKAEALAAPEPRVVAAAPTPPEPPRPRSAYAPDPARPVLWLAGGEEVTTAPGEPQPEAATSWVYADEPRRHLDGWRRAPGAVWLNLRPELEAFAAGRVAPVGLCVAMHCWHKRYNREQPLCLSHLAGVAPELRAAITAAVVGRGDPQSRKWLMATARAVAWIAVDQGHVPQGQADEELIALGEVLHD